jgi:hypothetical protein
MRANPICGERASGPAKSPKQSERAIDRATVSRGIPSAQ